MKKLFWFILLLVILQNLSISQTRFEGTYNLTSEERPEYLDEYIFSDDSLFKFTRLKYHANECGLGKYSVEDTVLTLVFYQVPSNVKDSLSSYYVVNESRVSPGDSCQYEIEVIGRNNLPLIGTSAQLVDEAGFNIIEKIKKYWEYEKGEGITVSFPKSLNVFGIKIANRGFETVVIPVKKDTNQTITVKMLELEKCFHAIERGTVRKCYLKNIRYSGFYLRDENSQIYNYFKKKKL